MSEFFVIFSQYHLIFTALAFLLILADLSLRPQSMKIMNVVWVISVIWGGVIALLLYFCIGRANIGRKNMHNMPVRNNIFKSACLSTLHCGAGCTLADIIGESSTITMNIPIAYQWTLDYILALIFGFAFQYIAIIEMNKISFKEAITRAIKADFLSLSFWQVGMYLFMGYALFFLYSDIKIDKASSEFFLLMQIAMFIGFIFSYPINILLIKLKIKSAM